MQKGRLKSKVSDDLSFKSIASEKTHIKARLKEANPTGLQPFRQPISRLSHSLYPLHRSSYYTNYVVI